VYSVRTPDAALFVDELKPSDDGDVTVLYTRSAPPGWPRSPSRLNRDDLEPPGDAQPRVYVCGPTGFVEAAAGLLTDIGYDERQIRTERFGPSGA
jgi:ferredoxin-NADP reductase